MPRRLPAFAANPATPGVTINAAWPRQLPGPGGAAVMMDPGFPVPARPGSAWWSLPPHPPRSARSS